MSYYNHEPPNVESSAPQPISLVNAPVTHATSDSATTETQVKNEQDPDEPLFCIDTKKPVEEEWKRMEAKCTEILIRELDSYSGRIQQRKGSVTRSTQLLLFGEELPRGHGYKGKLSSKISLLFDEITGRSPRKRSSRHVDHPVVMNPKRMILRPQAVPVGVIGDGVLAMLLVERLLQKHNQVIVWNKESLSAVQSDVSFSPILSACSPQSLQWQASLQTLVSHCSVILVAIPSEAKALEFYSGEESVFTFVTPHHTIIDCCIDDLTFSNKIHSLASSRSIPFYDCTIFPAPTTLQSFEKNQTSVFLGGDFTPSEAVGTILYSIGSVLFGGHKNQGIIYKMIVSQYVVIQEQALKEVYATARNLGVTDSHLLGRLLSMCANPTSIIDRNITFPQLDEMTKRSIRIPLNQLIDPIKQTFSIPSSFAPITSLVCQIGDKVVEKSSG
ncbi:hypothetical protein WA588_005337, partial [Blastocystis sp. NMH]